MTATGDLVKHGFTPTGLRLREDVTFEEWLKLGGQIAGFQTAAQWALGDWFFYGEWTYGSSYEAGVKVTGLSYQTLADLKYVAGRFEISRRREKLSVSHHREVAALPQDDADRWLDLAEQHGWSREKLRQALAGQLEGWDDVVDALDRPLIPPSRAGRPKAATAPAAVAAVDETGVAVVRMSIELVAQLRDWSPPVQVRVVQDDSGHDLQVRPILEADDA